MALTLTTPPVEEPVTLEELKSQLRIDSDDEDTDLQFWITAARKYFERQTWLQLVTATYTLKLDRAPVVSTRNGRDLGRPAYIHDGILYVPRPPLQSVTSITYVDSNNATQTWASSNYEVDTASQPGRITPGYGKLWPSLRGNPFADMTVVYVAGYGGSEDVPEDIKQAIRLLAAHFYENREATTPKPMTPLAMAVDAIIDSYAMRDARVIEFL